MIDVGSGQIVSEGDLGEELTNTQRKSVSVLARVSPYGDPGDGDARELIRGCRGDFRGEESNEDDEGVLAPVQDADGGDQGREARHRHQVPHDAQEAAAQGLTVGQVDAGPERRGERRFEIHVPGDVQDVYQLDQDRGAEALGSRGVRGGVVEGGEG